MFGQVIKHYVHSRLEYSSVTLKVSSVHLSLSLSVCHTFNASFYALYASGNPIYKAHQKAPMFKDSL